MNTHKKKTSKIQHFIKASLIFLFVVISTTGILAYFESAYIQVVSTNIETHERNILQMQNDNIIYELDEIVSDLAFLKEVYAQHLVSNTSIHQLIEEWMIFSDQKHHYDQIRFINKQGYEVIRINQVDMQAVLVAEEDLQDKSDRPYFLDTIELDENEIYISELDLNIELEQVIYPVEPTIRFSTPIYDELDQLKGILILNYRATNLLQQLEDLTSTSYGNIEILNEAGYWLSSSVSEQEFGFMFQEQVDLSFAVLNPDEWKAIQEGQTDIYSTQGHYLIQKVNLFAQMTSMDENHEINMKQHYWWILSEIPNTTEYNYLFDRDPQVFIGHLLSKYLWVILFVAILAGFLASLIYSNDENYSRVQFHSTHDGLTRILNRRAGLKRLEEMVVENRNNTAWITFCYLDINGLKEVNDTFGHSQGDVLIQTISECILHEIRETDVFMRLGGDEFLFVLTQTKLDEAQKVWDRILAQFERINQSSTYPYNLSVSHGLVSKTQCDNKSLDACINEADHLMYLEKRRLKQNLQIIKDEFLNQ